MLRGILRVAPGYAGGATPRPTYEAVSRGDTGHAEVVRIEYDPTLISLDDILTVFFATHDPTTLNRQGNDVGTQYRSAIYYTTEAQRDASLHYIAEINNSDPRGNAVVTEVTPLKQFFEAEDYHHEYFKKNPEKPYCHLVIEPKLAKVREQFSRLVATPNH